MLVATVNITFMDAKGKTSTTRVRIPAGLSFAVITGFAEALAVILKALTTAQITEVSVSVGIDLSGADLRTVATQFSDIFQKAFVMAKDGVAGLFAKFNIPTYDELNTSANSDQLNQADAEIIALITAIEDGITIIGPGLVRPVTSRNEDLALVTQAREVFRAS